jgi:hypothetical protein
MPSVQTPRRSRRVPAKSSKRSVVKAAEPGKPGLTMSAFAAIIGVAIVFLAVQIHSQYTFNLQSPVRLRFQSPLVIALRDRAHEAVQAQSDQQEHPLTAYQQYACAKFGSACRLALAIQRAENPQGKCEIYHYNTDGTLDWGYFQINTVHLKRPGLNLRDLLDCKANINFAYQLYVEEHGFTAWSTYNSGAYRRYLKE